MKIDDRAIRRLAEDLGGSIAETLDVGDVPADLAPVVRRRTGQELIESRLRAERARLATDHAAAQGVLQEHGEHA